MGDDIQTLEHNADAISKDDLPREIAFAKSALDVDDPATVIWLSELFKAYDAKIGFNA